MNKQETEKKIKTMSNAECAYPRCNKRHMMNAMLPIGKMTEKGVINFPHEGKESSVQASAPLCDYHLIFAQRGLINLVDQDGQIRLVGPFPIIEVVEVVLEAKHFHQEMHKKTKNAKGTKKAK